MEQQRSRLGATLHRSASLVVAINCCAPPAESDSSIRRRRRRRRRAVAERAVGEVLENPWRTDHRAGWCRETQTWPRRTTHTRARAAAGRLAAASSAAAEQTAGTDSQTRPRRLHTLSDTRLPHCTYTRSSAILVRTPPVGGEFCSASPGAGGFSNLLQCEIKMAVAGR